MAHSYFHAISSAHRWGGEPGDYLPVYAWMNSSKASIADFRHRALFHHAHGCFVAEGIFGTVLTNSAGRIVPIRQIAEQHIIEDLGRVPSFADWVRCIRPEAWMGAPARVLRRFRAAIIVRRRTKSCPGSSRMADHFTKFSCVLDVGSAENALRTRQLRDELSSEIERDEDVSLGFDIAFDDPPSNGRIILYSDDFGEIEHGIMFVRRCAESLGLTGRWGFDWAYDCSKARLDAFGGGACLLDLGSGQMISTLTTSGWLERELAGAGEQADANDCDRRPTSALHVLRPRRARRVGRDLVGPSLHDPYMLRGAA